MMVATMVVMALAAYFVAGQLGSVFRENRVKLDAAAQFFFDAPWIVAVLSIPALAATVPLVRGTDRAFMWMTISTLLVLLPLGYFLWAAASGLVPLYSGALGG